MISTAYYRLAKPFVSLSEMNPFAFAGFSASSRSKTQWREIERLRGWRGGRCTSLRLGNGAASLWKWHKTDPEMAPPVRSRRAGEEANFA
jgi:hypothetical protein